MQYKLQSVTISFYVDDEPLDATVIVNDKTVDNDVDFTKYLGKSIIVKTSQGWFSGILTRVTKEPGCQTITITTL